MVFEQLKNFVDTNNGFVYSDFRVGYDDIENVIAGLKEAKARFSA
jgi:hypothetical protein